MDTKLSNLSELANILSVKSSVGSNLLTLFNRFGLGHLCLTIIFIVEMLPFPSSSFCRRSSMPVSSSTYCGWAVCPTARISGAQRCR